MIMYGNRITYEDQVFEELLMYKLSWEVNGNLQVAFFQTRESMKEMESAIYRRFGVGKISIDAVAVVAER